MTERMRRRSSERALKRKKERGEEG